MNSSTRLHTTLYEKHGRRYYPVAEYMALDSFPAGAHLFICEPGSTLRRFNVDPDSVSLLAAAEPLRREIAKVVVDGHAMRPTRRPITPKQRAAWDAFVAAMGKDGYIVEYASVSEIADAVVGMLIERAKK